MSQRHLIFPHIPKTAGTSVRRNLKEAFEQDMGESYCEIGVYNMAGDWVNPKAFGAHVLPRDWTFVYGHATIQQLLANKSLDRTDARTVCLSFLRDPVDRCISLYNYIATTRTHPLHKECTTTVQADFFKKIATRDINVQHNFLRCARDIRWQFLIAPNHKVGEATAKAFELVTGRDLGASFFNRKYNITRKFEAIGTATHLSRSMLPDEQIQALYALNDADTAMFAMAKEKGILRTNPAWLL